MKEIRQGKFTGERALFAAKELSIYDSIFYDGESPLKESSDIELYNCNFKWKYPLWYSKRIKAENTVLLESARSGIWYTKDVDFTDCVIDAPKTFRRSENIRLSRVSMSNALESMWNCKNVKLLDVSVVGDYFGMGCDGVEAEGLVISGNYAFDGAKNIVIRSSKLISKDAFWNSENVTVYDSVIIGEYLGWNSKNVTFINCTVESNQGMCYMDGVVMKGCKLINTDLCFEYSTVDAEITTVIDSVKNPLGGKIMAPGIGELIMDKSKVDTARTEIIIGENGREK